MKEYVMSGLSVSHQQILKDMKDMQDLIGRHEYKIEEVGAQVQTWVSERVRKEIREQIIEMDAKKADREEIRRLKESKVERSAL